MEEIIQRLTKEKSQLLYEHRQEILLKDKMINELKEIQMELYDENKMLRWKLEEDSYIIENSIQAINGLILLI